MLLSKFDAPLSGPACLWKGFGSLFDRRWRHLVLVPLAINSLLFGAGSVWAGRRMHSAVQSFQDTLPGWLDWLAFLAWPLFGLALLFVFAYGFTTLANLIAAPFNVALARRVVSTLGVGADAPRARAVGGWILETVWAVANELRKLLYFLARMVPLGLLLWIPGVNLIAMPAWLLLGAWLLALEYLDYPLTERGLDFRAVRGVAREAPLRTLGFGGAILALSALPLVNLLLMPAAVIGACLWVQARPTDAVAQ